MVKLENFILSCLFPAVFHIRSVSPSEISLIKFSVEPAIPADPWETRSEREEASAVPVLPSCFSGNPHFISSIYKRLTEHRLARNQTGVHMHERKHPRLVKIPKHDHFSLRPET
ncbi:hypothetical protein MTP99_011768 [Tenebrio molitor]|jgi:hypothetical protein|uniref:Uncharacterized protein n=1 Tax=Tenebrio molitor TaxID=7067 RepID=A0A8J6HPU2_TENMO|nr:hypothetical protein GEV33_004935 [Tenebrio molitor]KAJ3630576.1 hypothetical protein MTP99_011768 [Tenebrio molitor]